MKGDLYRVSDIPFNQICNLKRNGLVIDGQPHSWQGWHHRTESPISDREK